MDRLLGYPALALLWVTSMLPYALVLVPEGEVPGPTARGSIHDHGHKSIVGKPELGTRG